MCTGRKYVQNVFGGWMGVGGRSHAERRVGRLGRLRETPFRGSRPPVPVTVPGADALGILVTLSEQSNTWQACVSAVEREGQRVGPCTRLFARGAYRPATRREPADLRALGAVPQSRQEAVSCPERREAAGRLQPCPLWRPGTSPLSTGCPHRMPASTPPAFVWG